MTTARLTWLVLDRLVPTSEEAYARAALIARDPDLHSHLTQGIISEAKPSRHPLPPAPLRQ